MIADGFNPVMAMLDLIDTLASCRDSGCECATDDDVELARDVIAWLTSELTERKMRGRARRPNRRQNGAVQASSPTAIQPSNPAAVQHQSNVQSKCVESLSLRSENSSLLKSSPEETSQENAGAHARETSAVQLQSISNPAAVQVSNPNQRSKSAVQSDDERLYDAMVLAWDPSRGLAMSGTCRSAIRALVPFVRAAGAERGLEPGACWAAASARFKADPGIKRGRYGLPTFLNQWERWLDPDEPQRRKGAPTPVSSASEFEAEGNAEFEAAIAASARQGASSHG